MKADKTVDYHIKSGWHAISRMYNSYAAPFDMTMAIGYVLLNIDKRKVHLPQKLPPHWVWRHEV